jgi:hypothetical protein
MNRRLTDSKLYRDFCDLAVMVLLTDSVVLLVFVVLWQLIKRVWIKA